MKTTQWQEPPNILAIKRSELHIWQTNLAFFEQSQAAREYLSSLLSEEEKNLSERLVMEKARSYYQIVHAVKRLILAQYTNLKPGQLHFSKGEQGKPMLKGDTPIQFNLSHAGDLCVLAVSLHDPVGIDIECERFDVDIKAIAKRFFSKNEQNAIFSIADKEARGAAFFRCWTRKEAYLKALGLGLSAGLDTFSVDISEKPNSDWLDLHMPRQKLTKKEHNKEQADNWNLFALAPLEGYYGAVVSSMSKTNLAYYSSTHLVLAK